MEPHCALKSTIPLLKNIVYYHYNANERFGLNVRYNLNGQIVGSDYKGIAIVNGKKIYQK